MKMTERRDYKKNYKSISSRKTIDLLIHSPVRLLGLESHGGGIVSAAAAASQGRGPNSAWTNRHL